MNIKFSILIFLCILSVNLIGQNFNYISDFDSDGVPLDMVNTPLSQSLVDNINASLPENFPVPTYNPQYLESSIETNVKITELADVWVSFVGEGAGYRNVLGYYTYDTDNPPTTPPADSDITIIFPNVSASGSGGGLEIGDKMYLGQFPAGKTVAWVLIANGWNGNAVTYGNWMVYSDSEFNPESSVELQKHNVNLYDNNEEVVVFGFEDIRRDYSSCDQDFNDALFLVTSNPYTAIETANYNPISQEGGSQGSGENGGLESNRGLSSKIAHRTFNRAIGKSIEVSTNIQTRSDQFYEQIIPYSFIENDRTIITSPKDLEAFTKADNVWSKDYFLAEKRYATVFITETSSGVYDHTKAVCERLKGAEIEQINSVKILENDFILSTLRTENGGIEYSISFVLRKKTEKDFELISRWAVDQYPKEEDYYNFQIWSSTPHMTKNIVNKIIGNLKDNEYSVFTNNEDDFVPNIYIKSGKYQKNQILLDVENSHIQEKNIVLIGSITHKENDDDLEHINQEFTIPSGSSQIIIESSEPSIFDLEVKIQEIDESNYDVAYFADGAWGLDYDSDKTIVDLLSIESNLEESESDYIINRNISFDISSEDYISIFKHLNPSGIAEDLQAYNSLEFSTEFKGSIKISLVKRSIENWKDQFSFWLNTNDEQDQYSIPFEFLRNKVGNEFNAEDITMLVFTLEKPGSLMQKVDFRNIRFKESEPLSTSFSEPNKLKLFPNPTSNLVKLMFESEFRSKAEVTIFNNLGIRYKVIAVNLNEGINELSISVGDFPSGAYMCNVRSEEGINESTTFFIIE